MARNFYHWFLAFWSALKYGFPSQKLVVIGVTGTNGKSTVVSLIHDSLRKAGLAVGSVSSLRFKINDETSINELKMTMPGRGKLQEFLAECVSKKCHYAVIEVTSEGVRQFRHAFINFDIAVFTNLTPEHIESHGSFEAYRAMKLKFFRAVTDAKNKTIHNKRIPKTIIVNLDDLEYAKFLSNAPVRRIGYTATGKTDDLCHEILSANNIHFTRGIDFELDGRRVVSGLRGVFNVANILAAFGVLRALGVPPNAGIEAVAAVKHIPGRMEEIPNQLGFKIFVDYAHTPDALQKVYETIQPEVSGLICILGAAGGGRDKWKRPEFGKIAAKFCREIILTNEDPYDDDPNQILTEVESGISNFTCQISKILDRKDAIKYALKSARSGDAVIITGKGAEPWIMGPKGVKIAWDDRIAVRESIQELFAKK